MNDEIRKQFEEWAVKEYGISAADDPHGLMEYANRETCRYWDVWQAAHALYAPRWIAVSERLPCGFAAQRVLIQTRCGQIRETLFCQNPKDFPFQYAEGLSAHFEWAAEEGREVASWMPLPSTEGLE